MENISEWINSSECHYEKNLYEKTKSFLVQHNYKDELSDLIIPRHVKKLNLNGKKFSSKREIEDMYENLLESILEEFWQVYSREKVPVILALYAFKKLNSTLSFIALHSVMSNKDLTESITRKESQQFYKLTHVMNNMQFKELEGFFVKDKTGIEILIETAIDKNTDTSEDKYPSDPNYFNYLLCYVRDVGELTALKEFVKVSLFDSSIVFDNLGFISLETSEPDTYFIEQIKKDNLSWLQRKEQEFYKVDNKNSERLSKVFKLEIGLNIEEVESLIERIEAEEDKWIITNISNIKKYFKQRIPISEEDLSKFINRLIRTPQLYETSNFSHTYRDSRVTKRCIIPLSNGLYAFADNVLIETLGHLKGSAYDRDIYSAKLKDRAIKVLHKIETDFEKAVETKLLEIEGVSTKASLEKITSTNIVSPNEIDLLVLKGNKLFVVECKNFLFKSDYKTIRSEVSRFKGEFSKKLNNKIQFVEQNLDMILSNEFGINKPNSDTCVVNGVFVTNYFSFSGSYEEIPYPSLNYTNVQDFFSQV